LIQFDEKGRIYLKLVDFGSSIDFSTPSNFGMITPEYMPPEVLKISEDLS
jgi:serine/threonine protein kinase